MKRHFYRILISISIAVELIALSGCVTPPAASLVSWDGKQGKVRQGVWGPIHEGRVEPEMKKIMSEKCANGFSVVKEGSDLTSGPSGSAEAKFKEFQCKN
jgi:hypothetical protein